MTMSGTKTVLAPRPKLSVVMPVHNAALYLDESIRSVLQQTFQDFELLLLNDASTDGSGEALREGARRDGRIRLLQAPTRLGLPGSADLVMQEARAAICARMDADDVCHPDRLRAQREALIRRPDVVLVGSLWEGIDARGRTVRPRDRWRLAHRSPYAPFPHGSIMLRREAFLEVGGYRGPCAFWEDLDLYYRLATRGRVLVLPEALYRHRFHADSTSARSSVVRTARAADLMHRCVARYRTGNDYEALLKADADPSAGGWTVSARALYSAGASRLWAGDAPTILELIRHVSVRPRSGILEMLMLGVWGQVSPRTLRSLLRVVIRLRDRMAGLTVTDGVPVEWRSR